VKNKIALINFPNKIKSETLGYPYQLYYFDSPINEYILTQFQGIFVYDPEKTQKIENLNFYKQVIRIDSENLLELLKNPLKIFDEFVGRSLLVNPRQFELLKGSVVKSKVDWRLGSGVVKDYHNKDTAIIFFTNAEKLNLPKEMKCHPSTLRVITHIQELKYHEKNRAV